MEFRLVLAAIAALAMVRVVIWLGARRDPSLAPLPTWDVALAATLAGVAIGRVTFVLATGGNPLTSPVDLIAVRAGVATGWASLAGLGVVVASVVRRGDVRIADALATPALAGLSTWHAACVVHGSCAGTVTDLPWSISIAGSPIGRHPVELYAALVLAVGAWCLWRWQRLPRAPVTAAGLALTLAAASRLATQPLRVSLSGGPVLWYAAAAAIGAAVTLTAWVVHRRHVPQVCLPEPGSAE